MLDAPSGWRRCNCHHAGRDAHLCRADVWLEDLDERFFRTTSDQGGSPNARGTLEVTAARLVSETNWNAISATKFALEYARHLLDKLGGGAVADGTLLSAVLDDAEHTVDDLSSDGRIV